MAVEVRPEIRVVQAIANSGESKNQWSLYFPGSLVYPDGVSQEDVEKLGHMELLELAGVLKERKTAEVTTEILSEVVSSFPKDDTS